MSETLLKLLGVQTEGNAHIVGVDFVVLHDRLGWVILVMLVLGVGSFISYRFAGQSLTRWRRWSLAALRTAFIVLLLTMILRPAISLAVEGTVRRTLLVAVDNSQSMQIADLRGTPEDLKRAAIAANLLDPAQGLDQPAPDSAAGITQPRRIDLVKDGLRNSRLDLLNRLNAHFNLRVFGFGQELIDLTPAHAAPTVRAPQASVTAPWGAMLMLVAFLAHAIGMVVLVMGWFRKQTSVKWWGGGIAGAGAVVFVAVLFWPVSRQPAAIAPESQVVAADLSWIGALAAEQPITAAGDAVRDLVARHRGQPIGGIVLITDGAINSGLPASAAAELARQEQTPLHIWGVGITRPRDIVVSSVFAPEVCFLKDEVPVTVRVRSAGLAGETAELKLFLGDQQVERREVRLQEEGEEVVALSITPATVGEFKLRAVIEPRGDEVVKTNNEETQPLRVVDERIKVLYVETSPRWEFRYLQPMLTRDRRLDAKIVLLEADAGLSRAKDSPFLPEIPRTREELAKFNLIIIGDVDPARFSPEQSAAIIESVERFGQGLIMLAGRSHNPWAYRSPFDRLIPVDFDPSAGGANRETVAERPIALELTPAGRASPLLRLADKDEVNLRIWQQLPPIYWTARVARPKPAAEVLLVDPDPAKASRFGKMPVVAVQQYGLGQVMFVGTDNTWRWRRLAADKHFTALWGQAIQRLGLPHLLGASRRVQLSADKRRYTTLERITIYARLYTETFRPVTEPSIRAFHQAEGQVPAEITMRAMPDQPGMYRAEFIAPAAGSYQFYAEREPAARLDFSVSEPRLEWSDTAMNEAALRAMAASAGGLFHREEDLHRLPDELQARSERIRSKLEIELWNSPLYLLLILLPLTAEWILRKVYQLK